MITTLKKSAWMGLTCLALTTGCAAQEANEADGVLVEEEEAPGLNVSYLNCSIVPQTPVLVNITGGAYVIQGKGTWSCSSHPDFSRRLIVVLLRNGNVLVDATEARYCKAKTSGGGGTVYSKPSSNAGATWKTGVAIEGWSYLNPSNPCSAYDDLSTDLYVSSGSRQW